MHSLPILLIALALLPLSAAVTCYQGQKRNGDKITSEVTCNSDYCGKFGADNGANSGADYGCGTNTFFTCITEGCHEGPYNGATVSICCCYGDLCNPAPSAPSLLLPSLAALAAVLAAHF